MKSTKIFIFSIITLAVIFLLFVGIYFDVLNSKNFSARSAKNILINASVKLSDQMIIDALGGAKKIERNLDGKVLVLNIKSEEKTKKNGDKTDAESTGGTEILAMGDLNNDGLEDAIIENTTCGATCGISLETIINNGDNTGTVHDITNQNKFLATSGSETTGINGVYTEKGLVYIKANGFLDEPNWAGIVTKEFKFENDKLNQVNTSSKNWIIENIETGANSKWKTLKNNKYNFSLQIPIDSRNIQLNTDEYSSYADEALFQSPIYKSVMVGGDEEAYHAIEKGFDINVITWKDSNSKNIKDLQDFNKLGRGGPAYENEKVIKIQGQDALTYTFVQPNGGDGYVLELLMKDRTLLEIIVGFKGTDGSAIFNRIISSLIFENYNDDSSTNTTNASVNTTSQNTTSVNTADWKTYSSTKYGFSIKYPEGTDINDIGYDGQNSSVLSFSFKNSPYPTSTVTNRMFYFITETKSWYDIGTPNMALRAPANCSTGFDSATSSVKINDTNFIKSNFTDSATGQIANTSVYCILKNGVSYKLEPMLVYSRDYGESKDFSPATVNVDNDPVLDQMVSTFRFIK